jgi:hypothetical protein
MMMLSPKGAGPLLALALLAADAGAARAQGQIVRLPEQDRALTGTAAQVFAIGKAEGADHEMFGEVSSVAFDAQDNLYVLDRQSKRVMVYDRAGRFVRQIGKSGQGPGELISPMQAMMGGDGTLVVSDAGRFGFSLFRPDGTFIRNVIFEGMIPVGFGLTWHPRGGVVGNFMQLPGQQAGQVTTQERLLFAPLAGGQPTQVFDVPSRTQIAQTTSNPSAGRTEFRMMRRPAPTFTAPTLIAALPAGHVALSFTSGYTVRIVDLNGQTLRYIQRPLRPRLTTERDREKARETQRDRMASGRGRITITMGGGGGGGGGAPTMAPPSNAQMQQMLGEMEFADTIPALRAMRASPSGRLLVERTAQDVDAPGPVDVITPEGQYLGTFSGLGLPAAVSASGRAAYMDYDDDGVARVIVRQLPRGWW